jgi:hypothetical protein
MSMASQALAGARLLLHRGVRVLVLTCVWGGSMTWSKGGAA